MTPSVGLSPCLENVFLKKHKWRRSTSLFAWWRVEEQVTISRSVFLCFCHKDSFDKPFNHSLIKICSYHFVCMMYRILKKIHNIVLNPILSLFRVFKVFQIFQVKII